MKLKDWREQAGLAQWQVAEQMTTVSPEVLGEPKRVTQQTVQTFETGRMPRKWHLQLLDQISDGAVRPNDFVELMPEDAAPKEERALIVQLCPRGREAAFEAAGWHTDERFADSHHGRYSAMMSRRRRPGEDWQALLAEIARLMGAGKQTDERAAQ